MPGPFQVGAALVALIMLFALIKSIFLSFMPLSWKAGCDICGVYSPSGPYACEHFSITPERQNEARYFNSCNVSRRAKPEDVWSRIYEHNYKVVRKSDDEFFLFTDYPDTNTDPFRVYGFKLKKLPDKDSWIAVGSALPNGGGGTFNRRAH